jgi:hypothetical protein
VLAHRLLPWSLSVAANGKWIGGWSRAVAVERPSGQRRDLLAGELLVVDDQASEPASEVSGPAWVPLPFIVPSSVIVPVTAMNPRAVSPKMTACWPASSS